MARLTPEQFLRSVWAWGDPAQGDYLAWDESRKRFRRRSAPAAADHEHGGWDDLRILPSAFDFAGNADPDITTWQPGGSGTTFRVWQFAPGDEAFFTCQLPHGYQEGSALKPHIHWTPADRGVAENGKTVAWALDVSVASVGGVFGPSVPIDLTDICSGTNDKHEMSPSGTIDGTGVTVSAMLLCRISRAVGDTWATNTSGNLPILLEVDIHYYSDTAVGSETETHK